MTFFRLRQTSRSSKPYEAVYPSRDNDQSRAEFFLGRYLQSFVSHVPPAPYQALL